MTLVPRQIDAARVHRSLGRPSQKRWLSKTKKRSGGKLTFTTKSSIKDGVPVYHRPPYFKHFRNERKFLYSLESDIQVCLSDGRRIRRFLQYMCFTVFPIMAQHLTFYKDQTTIRRLESEYIIALNIIRYRTGRHRYETLPHRSKKCKSLSKEIDCSLGEYIPSSKRK